MLKYFKLFLGSKILLEFKWFNNKMVKEKSKAKLCHSPWGCWRKISSVSSPHSSSALQGSSPGLFMLSGLKVNRLSPLCSTRVTPSQPMAWQWRVQQAGWLATHASRSAGRAVSNGEHLWALGRVDLKQRMPGATGSALAHNALPQRTRAHPNAPKPHCG